MYWILVFLELYNHYNNCCKYHWWTLPSIYIKVSFLEIFILFTGVKYFYHVTLNQKHLWILLRNKWLKLRFYLFKSLLLQDLTTIRIKLKLSKISITFNFKTNSQEWRKNFWKKKNKEMTIKAFEGKSKRRYEYIWWLTWKNFGSACWFVPLSSGRDSNEWWLKLWYGVAATILWVAV